MDYIYGDQISHTYLGNADILRMALDGGMKLFLQHTYGVVGADRILGQSQIRFS